MINIILPFKKDYLQIFNLSIIKLIKASFSIIIIQVSIRLLLLMKIQRHFFKMFQKIIHNIFLSQFGEIQILEKEMFR